MKDYIWAIEEQTLSGNWMFFSYSRNRELARACARELRTLFACRGARVRKYVRAQS